MIAIATAWNVNENKNEITLSFNSKKATVPISRSFYASFKKAFYEYMGGTT